MSLLRYKLMMGSGKGEDAAYSPMIIEFDSIYKAYPYKLYDGDAFLDINGQPAKIKSVKRSADNPYKWCVAYDREIVTWDLYYHIFNKNYPNGINEAISITFPDSIVQIFTHDVFNRFYSENLTEITFGNQLLTIGDVSFSSGDDCFINLRNINFGNSLQSIGDQNFNYMTYLEKLVLPDSLVSIGDVCIHECTALAEITIGKGIKSIGQESFYGNDSLEKVTILATEPPDIGEGSFDEYTGPIYVPSESVSKYKAAFSGLVQPHQVVGI